MVLTHILVIGLCLILYGLYVTYNSHRRLAKIKFKKWWKEPVEETRKRTRTYFYALFEDIIDSYDEVHIYSIFKGDLPLKDAKDPRILYVQYSGEPKYNEIELFDINIIPEEADTDTDTYTGTGTAIVPVPHINMQIWCNQIDTTSLTLKRRLQGSPSNRKFCLFAVSNKTNEDRNRFFGELSNYKRVDSCGKFMNNLGYNCPGSHDSKEYCQFISQYKFMICFENNSMTNYLTEKLLNAYDCNTIPIYWGCPNLGDYVNLSAILYLKSDYTAYDVSKLITEIKRLDNDDEAYKAKYESIFFNDGKVPDSFQIPLIKDKIRSNLDIKNEQPLL